MSEKPRCSCFGNNYKVGGIVECLKSALPEFAKGYHRQLSYLLNFTIENGHAHCLKFLLEDHAKRNVKVDYTEELRRSIWRHNIEMICLILKAQPGIRTNNLWDACFVKSEPSNEFLQFMLSIGARPLHSPHLVS